MKDEDSAFSFKDLITIVPVAGIILAAMYDVGFFFSAYISLFALFSWSDHIVFALGALFPALVIVSALGWALSKFTFDAPLKEQPHRRLWFLFALFVFAGVMTTLNLTPELMFWWLMSLITLGAIFLNVRLSGIVLAYSLALIFGAYAIGYADGTGILRVSRQQSLFTNTSQMDGRVFRSGERGLLFYDPATKKMSFLLWSEVKRLDTTVPNGPAASQGP
jgi:hypothetical protein